MSTTDRPTDALLYAYYGDDFTGSTDVLEQLSSNGVSSVLFFKPPTREMLDRFPGTRAIGIAGDSRSRTPQWMAEHLPPIFAALHSLRAPIVQYKTCSTFDSAPTVGSIGRAIELGLNEFGGFCPVVVAAPHLRRFVCFGNLFAAAGDTVYRIDRHPTMRQHPVTPMDEADLLLHLAKQTSLPSGLVDLAALQHGKGEEALHRVLSDGAKIVLFDGTDGLTSAVVADVIWTRAKLFAAGSSGLAEGLVEVWRSRELIEPPPDPSPTYSVDQLVVVSGSCSPVTESQIRWAISHGYAGIEIKLAEDGALAALTALGEGRGVVLYSALGSPMGTNQPHGQALGRQIGQLLKTIIERTGLRRAVVAGGDTSSHAVAELGLDALTWVRSLAPGAPLCRAHSCNELDGLELVLKGGQIGPEDFFERVRLGTM